MTEATGDELSSDMSDEDNFIDCKCPYCGETATFRDDVAGLAQECPNCLESLLVPAASSALAGKIPLPVSTPRLMLRRLAMADWQDLLEFLSKEELFEFVEGVPTGEDQIVQWLESDQYAKITSANTPFCLAITLQTTAKVIGYLHLHFTDATRLQTTVAVYVNPAFQRQGFATEAVDALLVFCFRGIGLHRVTAWIDHRHVAGCRLAEKLGMRREGEFLKDRFVNGEWVTTRWYAMLREEFDTLRANPPPAGPMPGAS
jgi:RimJ/RimL family protein N-acetyltransferase